ncbi:MAG: hypothetical protein WC002_00100 [Candidatus Muiribacteriota bacterium]
MMKKFVLTIIFMVCIISFINADVTIEIRKNTETELNRFNFENYLYEERSQNSLLKINEEVENIISSNGEFINKLKNKFNLLFPSSAERYYFNSEQFNNLFNNWNSKDLFISSLNIPFEKLEDYYQNMEGREYIVLKPKQPIVNKPYIQYGDIIKPVAIWRPTITNTSEWIIISVENKDYLFEVLPENPFSDNMNYVKPDEYLTNIKKEMIEHDEKIAQKHFMENEIKEMGELFAQFLKLAEDERRDIITKYENNKKLFGKMLNKLSEDEFNRTDLRELKGIMLEMTDLYKIKGSDLILNKSYSKYHEIADKLYITNMVNYTREIEKEITIGSNSAGNEKEIEYVMEKNKNYIVKKEKALVSSVMGLAKSGNISRKDSEKIDKEIFKYDNFKNDMTKQEYEEILKTEHGKSMLRSVYVLAKLDKTNEIWDSKGNLKQVVLERITLEEGVLYAGIAAITIGACVTGVGLYGAFVYGIGAGGPGLAAFFLGTGSMIAGSNGMDWAMGGEWPEFWWEF